MDAIDRLPLVHQTYLLYHQSLLKQCRKQIVSDPKRYIRVESKNNFPSEGFKKQRLNRTNPQNQEIQFSSMTISSIQNMSQPSSVGKESYFNEHSELYHRGNDKSLVYEQKPGQSNNILDLSSHAIMDKKGRKNKIQEGETVVVKQHLKGKQLNERKDQKQQKTTVKKEQNTTKKKGEQTLIAKRDEAKSESNSELNEAKNSINLSSSAQLKSSIARSNNDSMASKGNSQAESTGKRDSRILIQSQSENGQRERENKSVGNLNQSVQSLLIKQNPQQKHKNPEPSKITIDSKSKQQRQQKIEPENKKTQPENKQRKQSSCGSYEGEESFKSESDEDDFEESIKNSSLLDKTNPIQSKFPPLLKQNKPNTQKQTLNKPSSSKQKDKSFVSKKSQQQSFYSIQDNRSQTGSQKYYPPSGNFISETPNQYITPSDKQIPHPIVSKQSIPSIKDSRKDESIKQEKSKDKIVLQNRSVEVKAKENKNDQSEDQSQEDYQEKTNKIKNNSKNLQSNPTINHKTNPTLPAPKKNQSSNSDDSWTESEEEEKQQKEQKEQEKPKQKQKSDKDKDKGKNQEQDQEQDLDYEDLIYKRKSPLLQNGTPRISQQHEKNTTEKNARIEQNLSIKTKQESFLSERKQMENNNNYKYSQKKVQVNDSSESQQEDYDQVKKKDTQIIEPKSNSNEEIVHSKYSILDNHISISPRTTDKGHAIKQISQQEKNEQKKVQSDGKNNLLNRGNSNPIEAQFKAKEELNKIEMNQRQLKESPNQINPQNETVRQQLLGKEKSNIERKQMPKKNEIQSSNQIPSQDQIHMGENLKLIPSQQLFANISNNSLNSMNTHITKTLTQSLPLPIAQSISAMILPQINAALVSQRELFYYQMKDALFQEFNQKFQQLQKNLLSQIKDLKSEQVKNKQSEFIQRGKTIQSGRNQHIDECQFEQLSGKLEQNEKLIISHKQNEEKKREEGRNVQKQNQFNKHEQVSKDLDGQELISHVAQQELGQLNRRQDSQNRLRYEFLSEIGGLIRQEVRSVFRCQVGSLIREQIRGAVRTQILSVFAPRKVDQVEMKEGDGEKEDIEKCNQVEDKIEKRGLQKEVNEREIVSMDQQRLGQNDSSPIMNVQNEQRRSTDTQSSTYQILGQESNHEVIGEENTDQRIGQYSTHFIMGQESTPQMIDKEHTDRINGQENNNQVIGQQSTHEVIGQENNDHEVIGQQSSHQIIGQENISQAMEQENTHQIIGQGNADQSIGQEKNENILNQQSQSVEIKKEVQNQKAHQDPQDSSECKSFEAEQEQDGEQDPEQEDEEIHPQQGEESQERPHYNDTYIGHNEQEQDQTENEPGQIEGYDDCSIYPNQKEDDIHQAQMQQQFDEDVESYEVEAESQEEDAQSYQNDSQQQQEQEEFQYPIKQYAQNKNTTQTQNRKAEQSKQDDEQLKEKQQQNKQQSQKPINEIKQKSLGQQFQDSSLNQNSSLKKSEQKDDPKSIDS